MVAEQFDKLTMTLVEATVHEAESRISGDIMVATETSEASQKPPSGDIIERNPELFLAESKI